MSRRSAHSIALAILATVARLFASCAANPAMAQTPARFPEAATCAVRDFRSCHFLVHTDLPAAEARQRVERLEAMLRQVSAYWGRPMQGVIECYVVRDIATFPKAAMEPAGAAAIVAPGGVTVMRTATDGRRYLAKSVVYANARPEVAQHEAVHAYCHHTFGRIGPVWYSEGMAEMGHYWAERGSAVRADARELEYLHAHPPKSIPEIVSLNQASGDGWQSYAPRWALCHFLLNHPAYSGPFAVLGQGYLTGKDVSFEQTYGGVSRELAFEFALFIDHIAVGYRVDLCVWDWSRKFAAPPAGRTLTAAVAAGRGWQPTGLTVAPATQLGYAASGRWRLGAGAGDVDAGGDAQGRGRLVGALLNDYRLGPEFELGVKGTAQLASGGDLYLRCRNDWHALAGDSGRIIVKLKPQGRTRPPAAAAARTSGDGKTSQQNSARTSARPEQANPPPTAELSLSSLERSTPPRSPAVVPNGGVFLAH